MAHSTVFSSSILHYPLNTTQRSRFSSRKNRFCCSSAADSNKSMDSGKEKFMEFPYAPAPTKKLMVDLFSALEEQLGSSLHPTCTLPPDVQHFGNSTGTAFASLHLRFGLPSSQDRDPTQDRFGEAGSDRRIIDFILGGWIHCKLPTRGALNITSISAYLTSSTDAPHFLLDLIQSSPTSLVMILDLTPRKDLMLNLDYLKSYYEDTQLDIYRQRLHALPEVRPYISPSLYVRALLSPTAIAVTLDTGGSESSSVEGIVEDNVGPIAKEVLQFWMQSCACSVREVEDSEKACLGERDGIIKNGTVEADLGSSFPRLFGKEVADRALNALKDCYNK